MFTARCLNLLVVMVFLIHLFVFHFDLAEMTFTFFFHFLLTFTDSWVPWSYPFLKLVLISCMGIRGSLSSLIFYAKVCICLQFYGGSIHSFHQILEGVLKSVEGIPVNIEFPVSLVFLVIYMFFFCISMIFLFTSLLNPILITVIGWLYSLFWRYQRPAFIG